MRAAIPLVETESDLDDLDAVLVAITRRLRLAGQDAAHAVHDRVIAYRRLGEILGPGEHSGRPAGNSLNRERITKERQRQAGRMVTMDLTGWTPVHGRDGAVLGWMSDVGPEIAQERAERVLAVAEQAGTVAGLAALVPDPSFDAETAVAAGVTWAELDSASYVALALAEAELSGP